MRVALSTWNGRISPVFDVARTLLILDVGDARLAERHEQALDEGPLARIDRIAAEGVRVLVCGAISRPLAEMLASKGVRVIPFISGNIEEVVRAYLSGKLDCPRFAMPGCRERRGRARGRGGRDCRWKGAG
jgi:predicted Fe-Mo cluster-binding NifX family protein